MSGDDWIEHDGGACPVAPGELVCVQWRDGTLKAIVAAGGFLWDHAGVGADIVAYRLAEPEKFAEATSEFARRIDAELTAAFTVKRPRVIDAAMQLVRDAVAHSGYLTAQLAERDARIAELEKERDEFKEALVKSLVAQGRLSMELSERERTSLWTVPDTLTVRNQAAAFAFLPDPADPRLGRGNAPS